MLAAVNYNEMSQAIYALCEGESDMIALMAGMACEVHHHHPLTSWTGFYRVVGPNLLKIGPYQGGHGCLTIPFSRGVCGACAREKAPQLVPDVHEFDGHIACSATTQSELVLPVFNKYGDLLGVFDLDSDQKAAFTAEDVDRLTQILTIIFVNVARPVL